MNKTMIIGRVGKNCITNNVNGKTVGNFSVAVSKKINGEDKTTWYDVSIWEKGKIYDYIKKGGLVYIEGELSVRTYDKKEGGTGVSLQITAFQIELLGGTQQEAKAVEPKIFGTEDQNGLPF